MSKIKIFGTLYGKGFKQRVYCLGPINVLNKEDLSDLCTYYCENEEKLNLGEPIEVMSKYKFVPDPVQKEHKITFKQLQQAKDKVMFRIKHIRPEIGLFKHAKPVGVGVNGDFIVSVPMRIAHRGGSTSIDIKLRDGRVFRSESLCHPNDIYCKRDGIQQALDNLPESAQDEIVSFLAEEGVKEMLGVR